MKRHRQVGQLPFDSSLGHEVPYNSFHFVTQIDGNRKDELTIKFSFLSVFFFLLWLHNFSQAAQGYSIMAQLSVFHKS